MKKRDKVITIVVLVLFVAFLAYRYVTIDQSEEQEVLHVGDEAILHEVMVENHYDVPGKTRHVKYIVFVDVDGKIQDIKSEDLNDPTHQGKMDEFSAGLITMVRGEKLSELEEIDMVGTASLTTASFNSALTELKAAL